MSTILQALQKSNFDQTGTPPPVVPKVNIFMQWKVIISAALLVIIVLLSALIYLLLNPPAKVAPAMNNIVTQQPQKNHIVQVTFDTKPLPTQAPKAEITVQAPKTVSVQEEEVIEEEDNSQQVISLNEENTSTEVDYEDTPNDLKKRFELALLLSEIEENSEIKDDFTPEEGMNDGSDIRDMSSDFQNKVPLIRYDSHMYSSVVADRWIRINGEKLTEGEFDSTGQLELIEIQPQRSIFRLERQSFSVESLTDWKGY